MASKMALKFCMTRRRMMIIIKRGGLSYGVVWQRSDSGVPMLCLN